MISAPRRFLLVLPGAFGPTGGLEMYNRLILKGFHELARDVGGACEALVLLDPPGRFDARYLTPGAEPHGFAGSRPRLAAAVVARSALFRPDLIVFGHVNFSPLALAARAVRPLAAQWFLTHGIEVWRKLPTVQHLALLAAQKILSVSDFTRQELRRQNSMRDGSGHLLPCAIDPFWAADFAARAGDVKPDPARPLLLTVARLSETERYKGIDEIIRALPAIAKRVPGVRYAVIGDGTDKRRLEQVAVDAGVADRVEFRGRVSADALASAYAESSLFVMPSASEGFGIVYLEAALFGRPSIGGNHGGTPEVIADGETGRLVTHGDVAELASACADLLSDPARLDEMGRKAKLRLAERFTYATFSKTLRALAR